MDDKTTKLPVAVPGVDIQRLNPSAAHVMSRVVADALARAKEAAVAPKLFRIGSYEFCRSDHEQVMLWAQTFHVSAEQLLEWFEDSSQGDPDRDSKRPPFIIRNGSIVSVSMQYEYMDPGLSFDDSDKRFDLCRLPALEALWCWHIQLTELDLSAVPELRKLLCGENQLTELDLSAVPELRELWCTENELKELDLSAVPELRELGCGYNQLTELDLSAVPELRELVCGYNQLTELDLSAVPELRELVCWNNQLMELDLSAVSELRELWCGDNQLTELDLSDVPDLFLLRCSGNKIRELTIRDHLHLKSIICDPSVVVHKRPDQVVKHA